MRCPETRTWERRCLIDGPKVNKMCIGYFCYGVNITASRMVESVGFSGYCESCLPLCILHVFLHPLLSCTPAAAEHTRGKQGGRQLIHPAGPFHGHDHKGEREAWHCQPGSVR